MSRREKQKNHTGGFTVVDKKSKINNNAVYLDFIECGVHGFIVP
jgi:hypothetical protein